MSLIAKGATIDFHAGFKGLAGDTGSGVHHAHGHAVGCGDDGVHEA